MTTKIPKSTINAFPLFDVKVAEFAEQLRIWRAHMTRVEDDAAAGDKVKPADRHQAYGRPHADPRIEACVDGQGNVDYEIDDDSELELRARKNELLNLVGQAEAAAIAAVVPPGKQRLLALKERQIQAADQERASTIMAERSGIMAKLTGRDNFDLPAAIRAARPPADSVQMAMVENIRAAISQIEMQAAQAMHDIEDLTVDTIKQWKMPAFGVSK